MTAFHPAIEQWFSTTLGRPTDAQVAGWESIRCGNHTLIAPTGSGKTLAAFLIAIDDLLREGLAHALPDETRVVYVSPLKALSTDIDRNLAEPRSAIRAICAEMGLAAPEINVAAAASNPPDAGRADGPRASKSLARDCS